jgi:hypothetical protein
MLAPVFAAARAGLKVGATRKRTFQTRHQQVFGIYQVVNSSKNIPVDRTKINTLQSTRSLFNESIGFWRTSQGNAVR